MSDGFELRLDGLRESFHEREDLSPAVVSIVSDALEGLRVIEFLVSRTDIVSSEYSDAFSSALESFQGVKLASDIRLLEWVRTAADLVLGATDYLQRYGLLNIESEALILKTSAERASAMLDLLHIVSNAREALAVAQDAATKAKGAAGIAGGSSLSAHFASYAKTEKRAAETFRALSIAALLGAVIVAVFIHPSEGDWSGVVYRVAILGGVGALSAYFARQAGHHRRVFNWAKGLEVQLQSFPAFIEQTGTGARDDIYRAFAHRVLGAPPESSGSSDDTLPTGQLIEALIALAKRPN